MKKSHVIVGLLVASMLVLAGCGNKEASEAKVGNMSVEEVVKAMETGQCTVLDANTQQTRSREGKIPGATLLSHYKKYQPEELPQDKNQKLVFYCANQQCGASHKAAEKALLAGYTDVNVLPVGIAGWKQAGKTTETVQ